MECRCLAIGVHAPSTASVGSTPALTMAVLAARAAAVAPTPMAIGTVEDSSTGGGATTFFAARALQARRVERALHIEIERK